MNASYQARTLVGNILELKTEGKMAAMVAAAVAVAVAVAAV